MHTSNRGLGPRVTVRQGATTSSRRLACGLALTAAVVVLALGSDTVAQVAVRHQEGLIHGFLVLRSLQGKTLASGDLSQYAEGDRVTNTLTFHFKDGSTREETAVFRQHGHFQLISDRVKQDGPSFKQPMESFIDGATGQVKIESGAKANARLSPSTWICPAILPTACCSRC